MIYDVFTYNGERDLLDLRLRMLDEHVDKFIIVEAKTTFSGNKKLLHFGHDEGHFERWWKKIEYYIIDEDYSPEDIALANSSPNTLGAEHWKREFLQKESIKKALVKSGVKDDDTVYIGDVDEIWEPYELGEGGPRKLKLRVYAYYLDNRSDEEFWGPIVAYYKDIKGEVLNHLRSRTDIRTRAYYGWHFTSMGGYEEVLRKLNDSYTEKSYNTVGVRALLPGRIETGEDYLGRPFLFKSDTTDWPPFLKRNWKRYTHMFSPKIRKPIENFLQRPYAESQ